MQGAGRTAITLLQVRAGIKPKMLSPPIECRPFSSIFSPWTADLPALLRFPTFP